MNMAASSKNQTSPSSSLCTPILSRPTNPNARNSETTNALRRSFSGSPFSKPSGLVCQKGGGFNNNTPANSPSSEFSRRSSFGSKGNVIVSLRDHEDKENGRDQGWKQAKVRSPASSKGTKNFMSPTISAASKINASPRKKVLIESNETIRSSVALSGAKSPLMEALDSKPEKGSNQKKEVSFDSTITYFGSDDGDADANACSRSQDDADSLPDIANDTIRLSAALFGEKIPLMEALDSNSVKGSNQKEVFSDSTVTCSGSDDGDADANACSRSRDDTVSLPEIANVEKDCVILDPSFKISPRAPPYLPSPALASIDKDASMSPLAPLDADPSLPPYDPKTNYLSPRPQFLRYRPNPRIELYLNKEKDGKQLNEIFMSESTSDSEVTSEEVESQLDDLQRECDNSSLNEIKDEGQEEEEEELLVSERSPILSETATEVKTIYKARFFTRTRMSALALLLAIACLWISVNPPVMEPFVLNNLSSSVLYVPPELSEFTRNIFESLAQKLRIWLFQSLSQINDLITSFRERHKLGSFHYANLTALLEEDLVDGYLVFDQSVSGAEFTYEKNVLGSTGDRDVDIQGLEEEDQYIKANEVSAEDVPEADKTSMNPGAEVTELFNSAAEVANESAQITTVVELPSEIEPEDQPAPMPEAERFIDYTLPARQPQAEEMTVAKIESIVSTNIPESLDSDAAMENSLSAESVDLATNALKDIFSEHTILAISLLALSLLAATVFIYVKEQTPSTPNAADQVPLKKKWDSHPMSITAEQSPSFARNIQAEDDVVGESCPSDMSSYQNSSSYSKKGLEGTTNEVQSQGRKDRKNYRRESLASSDYSMGSPSYGSFTTYEKISCKHGEDEVITPVRRSSRIRNQVTSP